jgi:hypothetical protein
MRQMAHDRQHAVMMRGLHHLHHGAEPPPQGRNPFDRSLIGARRRHDQRPAALEQRGEPRIGAGELGAREGMAGHEMHPRRHQRPDIAQHRNLGRADIRQHGTRCQVRRDRGGDLRHGAHRRAEHDAIGARDRPPRIPLHGIGKAQFRDAPADGLIRVAGDDLADSAGFAGGAGDRTADQPKADQGQSCEDG